MDACGVSPLTEPKTIVVGGYIGDIWEIYGDTGEVPHIGESPHTEPDPTPRLASWAPS